jgi:hypothetical protein
MRGAILYGPRDALPLDQVAEDTARWTSGGL